MPKSHRNTDLRACGATTTVIGQSSVKVNGLLWAVDGDLDTHCDPKGPLKPTKKTVFIEGKNVIVVGDGFYSPDFQPPDCIVVHSPTASSGSADVYAYGS